MRRTVQFGRYSAFFIAMVLFGAMSGTAYLWGDNSGQIGGIVSFSAQVAGDETLIHAAPGTESDYGTGTLRAGDIVEIFFKNDAGWCAIRPPQGCYSWVNGNFVRVSGDGTGVIASPDAEKEVPVRVGADSVLKSSSVQIGLKSGRTVTILGETTLTGGQKWYKIAPPSGEFRWIHLDQLVQNDLLARIPSRLTREGEFSTSVADVSGEAADAAMGQAEELPNAILRPSQTADGSAPLTDGFHQELALLDRDLLAAVQSGSAEAFERLAERAANLFSVAADDQERQEAQMLYQKIKTYRSRLNPASGAMDEPSFANVASRTLYRHPAAGGLNPVMGTNPVIGANPARGMNVDNGANPAGRIPRERGMNPMRLENQPLAFTPPNAAGTNPATKKQGLKFAFADGNGPFSGFTRSSKKNGGTIVPPANYLPHSAASLVAERANVPMIGAMVGESGSTAKLAERTSQASGSNALTAPAALPGPVNAPNDTPAQQAPKPLPSEPFLAESPNAIKPVSAVLNNSDGQTGGTLSDKSPSADNWVRPQHLNEQPITAQGKADSVADKTADSVDEAANDGRFDAAGLLGYFPDRPDGYPPYALVRNDGDRLVILSYVAPAPGKEIDSFVGKNVGVLGKRGWFKCGADNRKLITVESVFPLGE